MVNQSSIALLSKLQKTIGNIESELLKCKEIMQNLEEKINEESNNIIIPKKTSTKSSKSKSESTTIDRNTIVTKIEAEFKENQFNTLSWLVKSKIKREEIIELLQEKGIVIGKSTAKNKISDEVKRILSNRYSFNKT